MLYTVATVRDVFRMKNEKPLSGSSSPTRSHVKELVPSIDFVNRFCYQAENIRLKDITG